MSLHMNHSIPFQLNRGSNNRQIAMPPLQGQLGGP